MTGSLLGRAYRRYGPRYLPRVLFIQQQLLYILLVLAVAGISAYAEMSVGEFARLALVACGLQFLYSLLSLGLTRRLNEPVAAWHEGSRSEEATIAAWRAAASFPWEVVRQGLWSLRLGLPLWSFYLVWSAYFVWELDLRASSVLLVYPGVAVLVLYAVSLRFFGIERIVRPVLEDIGAALPDRAVPRAPGLSVRARLLVALPAINIVTAAVANGAASGNEADLADLAVVVLIATAVAGTISLVLTVLLARSISEPLETLREATTRVGEGDFGTRVPVLTTDETGDLARSFNEMAAGLEERERIRATFGAYVDREVAEHILREGTSLEGEEVEVTVMFLDVRDFTGFAERVSPPDVVSTLNRLFDLVVPVIHEHGGHVDKFVGDGLLAVFGAPRRQPDHADQALAAALDIARRAAKELDELEVGIGLNSGTVVAGNVGGAGRLEFSVIGDAVNVAARVESATRQTGDVVLLAEPTRALLQDGHVPLEERRGVTLKGKREAVALYAPRADGPVSNRA